MLSSSPAWSANEARGQRKTKAPSNNTDKEHGARMPRGRKKGVSPKVAGIEKSDKALTANRTDNELKAQFLSERTGDRSVKQAQKAAPVLCACCGKALTEANGVRQPKRMFLSGYHPICLVCQQNYYATVSATTSRTYALFYACVAFNLPYRPSVLESMTANQNGVWYEYVKRLEIEQGEEEKGSTWVDGITNIAEAFGGDFPVLPITGDVVVANMAEMSNRDRWNIEWGESMSDEDCRNADDRYMMMTANRSGGTIPASVSMYLHDAIRYMIARDKASDSMEAKRYQEMADKLMNSDSVKNWQSNKGETIQVDRVARHLESMGAMQNGYLVSRDELAKILSAQHGSYSMCLDVVDCMIERIVNTMRKNNGDAELAKLPVSAQVTDAKGELLAEMSAEEKKIIEGMGMKPPEREKAI